MNIYFSLKGCSFAALLIYCSSIACAQKTLETWITNADHSALFEKQPDIHFSGATKTAGIRITIDDKKTYQPIDGFGFALTGGSAMHIVRMDKDSRSKLLQELFDTEGKNIGISYLRVSIGASDLNSRVFTYDDMPDGSTDMNLTHFDLGPDKEDVIPVLREILTISPSIKILASPWSPPSWMKTSNDSRGGRLKHACYPAYAKYFVRYIQEMKKAGVLIDAITVQNEPLHPGNNPSLLLTAPEEADFIKNHLGPAFKAANLKTKIIIYDHNADRPDYPISILDDREAKKYIDGSGFHLYGGKIEALSDVHDAHPDKNIYFTEQMVVQENSNIPLNISSPVKRLIIGATRNWCRNVLEWNLAADPQNKPFTDRGGCSMCQGAVTIDGNSFSRNIAYYSIAHASKFVRPGSFRIASSEMEKLPNVAFKTPAGKKVLVVVNDADSTQQFSIMEKGQQAVVELKAKSTGTYIWN